MKETHKKIMARMSVFIIPTKKAPATEPDIPPITIEGAILQSMFCLWLIAAIQEEKGMTSKFIPKALSKGSPEA